MTVEKSKMKLFLVVLLSVFSYHCCIGYPVVEGEISEDILIENDASIDYLFNDFNETSFTDSLPVEMQGFFKKVLDKVKDKIKGGLKVKDKIKDCKDILNILAFSVPRDISEDILIKNETSIDYLLNVFNETSFNDSSPVKMQGFFKKVLDKVKDKVKGGLNKVKDKIKACKDILKILTFSVTKEISESILTENVTSIEYLSNASNDTTLNESLEVKMQGFFKKVKDKVKDGLNKVKDCKDILKVLTFAVTGDISEDSQNENGTSIKYLFDDFNQTPFNDSLRVKMQGFFKKVFDKVKDKMKDGLNKGKDKIKNCKDLLKILAFSITREISEDILSENGTFIEYLFNVSNETIFNNSSSMNKHGFGKKVVGKVKDRIKTVKDKIKDGFNKVKDKIKDLKDKIGSKGGSGGGSSGGSGGGYYRDKYGRDSYRDKYDKEYHRNIGTFNGGSGSPDPNAKWIVLAVGVFMVVGFIVTIIYYKIKK